MHLRPDRPDDAGTTLIELVVGMGLTVLLGAVTLMLAVNVNRTTASTTDRAVTAAQARTALQAWADYLQVSDGTTPGSPAHRFEWITNDNMLFHADLSTRAGTAAAAAPVRVWLRRDTSSRLVEEQFRWNTATSAYNLVPAICRILATRVTSLTFVASTTSGTAVSSTGTFQNGSGCINLSAQPSTTANAAFNTVSAVSIDAVLADTTGSRTDEYSIAASVPVLVGT